MMSLKNRLDTYRKKSGVAWELIEQDYALSWMLFGIAHTHVLHEHLVFKGGTCLKKCYFGEYRFSQDLDFSVRGNAPRQNDLENLIHEACAYAMSHLENLNTQVSFKCERYIEKRPHPNNQEAFCILVKYPWQRDFLTRIMVEITLSEPVILPVQNKLVIHPYGDEINASLNTYALEEIVAEKIRAILQFYKKLFERSWGRSRARDYYDLWRILKNFKECLDKQHVVETVQKKCVLKEITFNSPSDLFQDILLKDLDVSWTQWVGPLVTYLPEKEQVLQELRENLESLFSK